MIKLKTEYSTNIFRQTDFYNQEYDMNEKKVTSDKRSVHLKHVIFLLCTGVKIHLKMRTK